MLRQNHDSSLGRASGRSSVNPTDLSRLSIQQPQKQSLQDLDNLYSHLIGTVEQPGEFTTFCRDKGRVPASELDPETIRMVLNFRESVESSIRARFETYAEDLAAQGFLVFHRDSDLLDTFVTLGPNGKPTHVTFITDMRFRSLKKSEDFFDNVVLTNNDANCWAAGDFDGCMMIQGPLWEDDQFSLSPVYGDRLHPAASAVIGYELQQKEHVSALAELLDEAWETAARRIGFRQADASVIRRELTSLNEHNDFVSTVRDKEFKVKEFDIKFHRARKETGALVPLICSVVESGTGRIMGQSKSPLAYFVAREEPENFD